MASIFSWIKSHKLIVLLTLIIIYLLFGNSFTTKKYNYQTSSISSREGNYLPESKTQADMGLPSSSGESFKSESPPTSNIKNRLVIKESNLSLLVDKVIDSQKKILQKVQEAGGYMVSVDLSNPQEEATSTVVVRIPVNKLDQILEYFRSVSVKVISENLQGQDVTDQYVDLQARLDTLNKTRTKFEQIMDKAIIIQDILDVQRELINLQSEIDSIKGQQQYYEKNAEMTKITVYLSTDELTLPYAPSESWRPKVIFKQAIRSLIGALRSLGTLVIWIVVYSIIWVPVLIVIILLRRRKRSSV